MNLRKLWARILLRSEAGRSEQLARTDIDPLTASSSRTHVGLHIPKCAGTSILAMLSANLPNESVYQSTSLFGNFQTGKPQFFEIEDFNAIRLVWGHCVHEQMLAFFQEPILFTGLRHPVERLRSDVNFLIALNESVGKPFDANEYLKSQKNPMTQYIVDRFPILADNDNPTLSLLDKAKRVLSCFKYIYFVDDFAVTIAPLAASLGVQIVEKNENVGLKRDDETAVDKGRLAVDLELYDWAKSEFAGGTNRTVARGKPKHLRAFLEHSTDDNVLQEFLFSRQAEELYFFGVLDEVIQAKRDKAYSGDYEKRRLIMKELQVYRQFKESLPE